jgi:hypothetical protein
MAKKLDPMDLKQIIRLNLDSLSNRDIGKTLGISRNTVNQYMNLFTASELPLLELLDMEEGCLRELFPVKTTIKNERYNELMKYFERVTLLAITLGLRSYITTRSMNKMWLIPTATHSLWSITTAGIARKKVL